MLLVLDLEATCADDGSIGADQMEIIEVGAVWASASGEALDTFQAFVRPVERPSLTAFCMALTGIVQASVDAAAPWPAVAGALAAFARRHPGEAWGSWGGYDERQIGRDCARHGVAHPLGGRRHRNIKSEFARARSMRPVGMAEALALAGLDLQGRHHRALDDALNLARLLPALQP